MMGSNSEGDDDGFFDASQEVSPAPECDSGGSSDDNITDVPQLLNSVSNCLQYEAWTKCPSSVTERRRSFMQLTGIATPPLPPPPAAPIAAAPETELHILPETNETIISENGSSTMCSNSGDEVDYDNAAPAPAPATETGMSPEKKMNLVCEVKSVEEEAEHLEYVVEFGMGGEIGELRELGSNRLVSIKEFDSSFSTNLVQQLLRREEEARVAALKKKSSSSKRSWMKRLSCKVRISSKQGSGSFKTADLISLPGQKPAMTRVRVNPFKKNVKELTSLYTRQDFEAHYGSILTMKFNSGGQYLASGGRDGIIRVWEVSEDARLDESDIPDDDSSCLYFPMNQPSKLAALDANKEKMKRLKKSKDMACAVLSPKVFWISENPLHEFEGHSSDVLDLSWSKGGHLLSSSTDKTVRLWKVGSGECLEIFPHNNYVTCVSFNPIDNDYFISGSIDGLVRLWEVPCCQVVHYIDLREIVTAVSFRPNGKEAIVGSMSSNCYIVSVADNRLRLEATISLKKKKKTQNKRVTGFEFCPNEPRKVLITAADSSIRVLYDKAVIYKFKSPQKGGTHTSATFTPDGKHIVSANEDSHVRIWTFKTLDRAFSGPQKIRSSETFLSDNALIAVPWCGSATATTTEPRVLRAQTFSALQNTWKRFLGERQTHNHDDGHLSPMPGSPSSAATTPSSKSEYKLLKGAWQSMSSADNMWGVVIVTAGFDGRIRTYQNYGLPVGI